ncbi:MAG: Ger(x)C family spore germination C-terminal domain-containing protein [Eubacteriales bacterium]|nr:Ger(x)C family spore germination C-terminal domain-containing protein [Eubacteriales bacterium]
MKRIAAFFVCVSCLLLCGCSWKDAGDLSAVTAGAIVHDDGQYTLTAELAIPSSADSVPDAQLVSGQADSMAQAIDNTGYGLDAQLYWSHARVLFLDKSLLRTGIQSCIQELTHSSEVRPAVRLCAVRNTDADGILSCDSISGEPVGFSLGDSISYAVQQSQTPDMPLYRVLDRIETAGMDPVLPAVSIQSGHAVLSGCALFSGDTLQGWLDEQQTSTLSLLLAAGNTATVYHADTRYQLRNIRTNVTAQTSDSVQFTVDVDADVACETSAQAKIAATALKEQSLAVVEALQQAGCDALGFGRAWERADAPSWRQADRDAWQEIPVTVHITLHPVQSAEGGSR